MLRTFRLWRNTIPTRLCREPLSKGAFFPRGGDGGALYKYEENVPKWDVFIHLMEMGGYYTQNCEKNTGAKVNFTPVRMVDLIGFEPTTPTMRM